MTQGSLFAGFVAGALGELAALKQHAQEHPLDHALLTYCKMVRAPEVLSDCEAANAAWGANCGPMSLAVVLGLGTVEQARALVQPFRGFMTPTNMVDSLVMAKTAGLAKRWIHIREPWRDQWPVLGLVRIQWLGPWCRPEVDPRAAYNYTHWIGVRRGPVPAEDDVRLGHVADDEVMVYDCTPNRWIPLARWTEWVPSIFPKRATGWQPATLIDVQLR